MTKLTAAQAHREIVFHAYPRLIFAWPIILLGFLLYPLDAWGLVRADILAWLWGSTLFVVILFCETFYGRFRIFNPDLWNRPAISKGGA